MKGRITGSPSSDSDYTRGICSTPLFFVEVSLRNKFQSSVLGYGYLYLQVSS